MSLYGVMRTSASGMAAQGDRLGAVADNIANASTTGYKRSTLEFSTMVIDPGVKSYESGSVEPSIRHVISEQGAFNYTRSVTDIGIKGEGFFVVGDESGQSFLTRAGSFVQDGDGNLVNTAGFTLMGYDISAGPPSVVANGTAGLVPVNISQLALVATPSTEGSFYVNLPSNADITAPASLPSINTAAAQFDAKTSLTAFDNLGNEVTVDTYFTKTAAGVWEVAIYDHSAASASGGFPYTAAAMATTSLSFDAHGKLTAASPKNVTLAIPGGASLLLDLSQTSQLAADYAVLEAQVNGNAASAVDRVEVADDGTLYSIYENGGRVASYRIPLADVPSIDNMQPLVGNVYQPTGDSGNMRIGFAGANGFGSMVSGAVEKSTVDIATELTILIEAEKNYTANSKVFQTGADLMDVLVNLKR